MFCSVVAQGARNKSPKIVCWLPDTVRGVLQTWKTRIIRCKSRLVRNAAFFEQNVSYAFQLKSTDKLSIILLIASKFTAPSKVPAPF